jgi:hypothetical protein
VVADSDLFGEVGRSDPSGEESGIVPTYSVMWRRRSWPGGARDPTDED